MYRRDPNKAIRFDQYIVGFAVGNGVGSKDGGVDGMGRRMEGVVEGGSGGDCFWWCLERA